ncbi:MAG TPA: TetR/AcrR family transcriptional regulator [Actinocrinis sp.]
MNPQTADQTAGGADGVETAEAPQDDAAAEAGAGDLDRAWHALQPAAARRLLIAAVEAFTVHGYQATTTRDIASRAGLSPAGVYVHFRSKEELLYRICLFGHQQTLALVRAAAAGEADHASRLAALIGAFTVRQARFHSVARVIEYDLRCLSAEHHAEISELRREIDRLVRELLADGAAAGAFDVPDPAGTALALLSLCTDVARWYHASARRPPEELGRLYADLALRMVRPSG